MTNTAMIYKKNGLIPYVYIPAEIRDVYRHLQKLIAQEEAIQNREILE